MDSRELRLAFKTILREDENALDEYLRTLDAGDLRELLALLILVRSLYRGDRE